MESELSVLRSGRRWRRMPSNVVRSRKGPIGSVVGDDARSSKNANTNPNPNSDTASQFSCSICLETAKEPVVTSCGHLFCWPCIYRWVHLYSSSRECPVCKAAVEVEEEATVTPIYGIYDPGSAERADGDDDPAVPPRPDGRPSIGSRDTPLSDVIVGMMAYREQIQTLDQTRAAIDRVWSNLETVDRLVREVTSRAARLERGGVGVFRIRSDIFSESSNTRNGISRVTTDHGRDGVYRRTRRRLADS